MDVQSPTKNRQHKLSLLFNGETNDHLVPVLLVVTQIVASLVNDPIVSQEVSVSRLRSVFLLWCHGLMPFFQGVLASDRIELAILAVVGDHAPSVVVIVQPLVDRVV